MQLQRYVNNASVPLSLAVFLATDNYDYDSESISATSLLKPIRQIILAGRVPATDSIVDIMTLVQSRMGSAIHDGIERAWTDNHAKALQLLGYPQRVIDRVKVNPERGSLQPNDIPVYLEQRVKKKFGGYTISGKFDFVGEGRVEDFKSTSVNTWINHNNDEKYILQGSIYRWLNPDIVTQDTMAIQFIFTDWAAMRARTEKNYPPNRTMQRIYHLKSIPETEAFVRAKLALIERYKDAPEADLPLCSDEDLWRKDPVWKYYKNPDNRNRSTKNFDNRQDAYVRMAQDGNVGVVIEVPGQAVACKYCPAFPVCSQKDALIAAGDLQL